MQSDSVVPVFRYRGGDNSIQANISVHQNTKLTPVVRKEVFARWAKGGISLRKLAADYHVDKRVVQRIIARGEEGDFSVHSSVNHRYLNPPQKPRTRRKK